MGGESLMDLQMRGRLVWWVGNYQVELHFAFATFLRMPLPFLVTLYSNLEL